MSAPWPPLDHLAPLNSRELRRRDLWLRCLQIAATGLLAWTLWGLLAACMEFNERRIDRIERAQFGKAPR